MKVLKYFFFMIFVGGSQLSHVVELKCKFQIDTNVEYGEKTYCCEVSKLKNGNNNMVIKGYTGKHYHGKKETDVKIIKIGSSPLRYIPANIGSLFNLIYFYVTECELIEIKADNFIGMENLELLDLTNNELKSIKTDTFAELPNLTKIILNQNKIKEIQNGLFSNNVELTYIDFYLNNINLVGDTLFDGLTKLIYVNFQQNKCIREEYEENDITLLKKDIIELCANSDEEKFRELNDEILKLKTEIEDLKNELKNRKPEPNEKFIMKCAYGISDTEYVCTSRGLTIDQDDVTIDDIQGKHLGSKSNTDVSELIIKKSNMLYLSKDIFKHLLELKALQIDDVNLNELSEGNFNGATKLKTLYLMKNDIKQLQNNIFDGAEQLTIIKMDSNKIEEISKGTFNGLKLLKTLSIRNNLIEELHLETFKNLVNLNDLILSQNNLKFLDGKLLEFNVKLEFVSFEQNQLREIGEDIFKNAKKLQNINLYQNTCIGDKSNDYEFDQLVFVIKHCCKNSKDRLGKYNCGNEGWES